MLRHITKRIIGAQERVDYLVPSPLAKDLIAAIRPIIDDIKNTRPPDAGDNVSSKREGYVLDLLKKNLRQPLTSIIKKHTNIDVTVVIRPYLIVNALWSTGFRTTSGIKESIIDIYARSEGAMNSKNISKATEKLTKEVSASIDENKGVVSQLFNDLCNSELHLYIGLFMIDEFRPAFRCMTAEEITGIILHEIGHGITNAITLGHTFHQCTIVRDTVNYLKSTADDSDALSAVKASTAVMKASSNKAIRAKAEILDAAVNTQLNRSSLDRGFIDFAIKAVTTLYTLMVTGPIANSLVTTLIPHEGNKVGDQRSSLMNVNHHERAADEFAARHGMAGAQASALNLLHLIYGDTGYPTPTVSRIPIIGSLLGAMVIATRTLSDVLDVPLNALATGYDDDLTRLKFLLQGNMVAFKDPHLPREARDQMLMNIDEIQALIKQHESRPMVRMREFLWGTLFRLTKPGTFFGMMIDANNAVDYNNLQKATAHLIRTPLYATAARIQQLNEQSNTTR